MDTFQELESSRLRVLRDSAWCLTNIGSASCVGDDQVEDNILLFTNKYCKDYEDTRQCLESCDLEEGLQQFISQHQTGSEGPPPVTCQSLPNSSTLGMGHMAQQRQLTNHTPQEKQYDTHSLGRATPGTVVGVHHTHNAQSLTTLSEIGRSRSDLGYTPARQDINQSHRSSHTAQPPLVSPNNAAKPPTTWPNKPPRIIQYPQTPLSSGKSGKPISLPITSRSRSKKF